MNALLPGEGDTTVEVYVRRRCGCDNCGEPATKLFSFCYVNGRRNPASSMYGRDDCTYCSDAKAYACEDCQRDVQRVTCPDGMTWGATHTLGNGNEHMFLCWEQDKAAEENLKALAKAEGTT